MAPRTSEEKRAMINTPLHGIFIPSFFILAGSALLGLDKLIYGIGLVMALCGWRFYELYFIKTRTVMSKTEAIPFELIDQTIITKDSAIYRFKLADEEDSLEVPLGHHLGAVFTPNELVYINEDVDTTQKEYIKYYTPISNKYDKGFFDILVKSYPTGNVSKKFASLNVHQNVKFKGPVGRFDAEEYLTLDHCDSKDKTVILIAGGSGITPFLRILIESPMKMNFRLIYYSKTPKDVLLKNELDQLDEHKPSFSLKYLFGLLTEENLKENIGSSKLDKSSTVLICGPPEFKQKAKEVVEDLGFSHNFVF